ncbi:reactive intermediate/imine deaminase, partial [Salmonella enterica subsp. enterica serovar 4,12:i:-]
MLTSGEIMSRTIDTENAPAAIGPYVNACLL